MYPNNGSILYQWATFLLFIIDFELNKKNGTHLRKILFAALFSSLNTLDDLREPSSIIQPLCIVPPSFLSDVFTSIS